MNERLEWLTNDPLKKQNTEITIYAAQKNKKIHMYKGCMFFMSLFQN